MDPYNQTPKVKFVRKLQDMCTQLAQIADITSDLNKLYFDRGYNGGGASEITDLDLQGLNVSASDIVLIITMLQQFDNFAGSLAVLAGDYKGTMNRARTDM